MECFPTVFKDSQICRARHPTLQLKTPQLSLTSGDCGDQSIALLLDQVLKAQANDGHMILCMCRYHLH